MAKRETMGNVCLQWSVPERGNHGDGVSRPKPNEATRPYTLIVRQGNARPMKVTYQAPSKRAAIRYAKNRWPGAEVEVP